MAESNNEVTFSVNWHKNTLRDVELVGGPFDGEIVTLFRFVGECQMQGRPNHEGRSVWHTYKMTTRDSDGRCVFEYEGCY